jgi:hypothetical protein
MGLESRLCNSLILILSKRPLVDDSAVSGIVEYAGCDPRLHVMGNKARVSIQTHKERGPPPKEKRTSSTSQPPRLTPRTFCAPYGKFGLNDARAEGRRPARARRTADVADENMLRNVAMYGLGKEWRRKVRVRKPRGTTLDECHPLYNPEERRLEGEPKRAQTSSDRNRAISLKFLYGTSGDECRVLSVLVTVASEDWSAHHMCQVPCPRARRFPSSQLVCREKKKESRLPFGLVPVGAVFT